MDRSALTIKPERAPVIVAKPRTAAPRLRERSRDLVDYFRLLWGNKWKLLALLLLGACLGVAAAAQLRPSFTSTGAVQVVTGKQQIVAIDRVSGQPEEALESAHFQTQVELLRSQEVAEATIRSLQLWNAKDFDPRRPPESWLAKARAWLRPATAPLETDDDLTAAVLPAFTKALKVDPVGMSRLIRVSFSSHDAALAARVATAHMKQYLDVDRASRVKISQDASAYVQDQLESLRSNLARSEQALQAYREAKGIVTLDGSAQAVAGRQVGSTSERLIEARSKRAELQSVYEQLTRSRDSDYSDIPFVMRDPEVAETLRQVNETKRKLAQLSETLGPRHTQIQALHSELAQLNDNLRQARNAAVAGLRREYQAAVDTEQALAKSLSSVSQDARQLNREEFALTNLEREVQTNRELFDLFMSRSKEMALASDIQTPVARVVDVARIARQPSGPGRALIVAAAALLSLMLGSLWVVLRGEFDRTIRSLDDIEDRLGLPALAQVPRLGRAAREAISRRLIDAPRSEDAVAVRTILTGVMLADIAAPTRTVLVTSALPNEGKTTLACNLALASAQAKLTLLIDGDTSQSQLTDRLMLTPGQPGLTNVLAGQMSLDEALCAAPDSPLVVLPVGDEVNTATGELFLGKPFHDLLGELSERFEVIIIDSPPVELIGDALALTPLATTTLLVIRTGSTRLEVLRRTVSRLLRSGAGSIQGVLNFAEPCRESYGYYREPEPGQAAQAAAERSPRRVAAPAPDPDPESDPVATVPLLPNRES